MLVIIADYGLPGERHTGFTVLTNAHQTFHSCLNTPPLLTQWELPVALAALCPERACPHYVCTSTTLLHPVRALDAIEAAPQQRRQDAAASASQLPILFVCS